MTSRTTYRALETAITLYLLAVPLSCGVGHPPFDAMLSGSGTNDTLALSVVAGGPFCLNLAVRGQQESIGREKAIKVDHSPAAFAVSVNPTAITLSDSETGEETLSLRVDSGVLIPVEPKMLDSGEALLLGKVQWRIGVLTNPKNNSQHVGDAILGVRLLSNADLRGEQERCAPQETNPPESEGSTTAEARDSGGAGE